MSRRGPPPLPSSVKKARGTFRPCRAEGEPASAPGTPTAPDWLGADARREWARIVPMLRQRGLLELVDRAALTGYCQAWGDMAEASRALAEQGTTVIGSKGQLLPHPELRRLEVARQALRQFAQEFGLSPSARSRVHAAPPEPPAATTSRERARIRFFGTAAEREALRREFGGGA